MQRIFLHYFGQPFFSKFHSSLIHSIIQRLKLSKYKNVTFYVFHYIYATCMLDLDNFWIISMFIRNITFFVFLILFSQNSNANYFYLIQNFEDEQKRKFLILASLLSVLSVILLLIFTTFKSTFKKLEFPQKNTFDDLLLVFMVILLISAVFIKAL